MNEVILVVDDDSANLMLAQKMLGKEFRIAAANSGKAALRYLEKHKPDLILLDINMPAMNGFKTLERFRNQKECINVPVVFVTGQRDRYTVMNSIFMGGDGYLIKPVQKDDLQKKVLELYRSRKTSSARKTILAIDDDMAYLKLIDSYLKDMYNVVIINSTKLAFSYLMKNTPDLVLLDYQMPLYNGASFLNILNRKKEEEDHTIPVIILSGTLDKETLKNCYAANPDAILAKPISKEDLLDNIAQVLNP